MITLLEHEGKTMLRAAHIPIPLGMLAGGQLFDSEQGYVVKAQVPAGGRGKMGGIKFADDASGAVAESQKLQALGMLGEHAIESIYIEQKLDIDRELYLAVTVDRDLGCATLIASADGGMDIEAVPADRIVMQRIDPALGLPSFALGRLRRELSIPAPLESAFDDLVKRVIGLHADQDCELLEINPLVVSRAGELIAADCKVTLDEDAGFRHPGRKQQTPRGSAFETRAREIGVIGVEIAEAGQVVAIMNGAGMTMATLDQLVESGCPPRAVVELHGITAHDSSGLEQTIALCAESFSPKVILLNVHFQFRRLDIIAQAVQAAVRARGDGAEPRLVIRLKGVEREKAAEMLSGLPIFLTDSFSDACDEVVRILAQA